MSDNARVKIRLSTLCLFQLESKQRSSLIWFGVKNDSDQDFCLRIGKNHTRYLAKKGPESADKIKMKKQVVNWKPIRGRNALGEIYLNHYFPQLIDSAYRAELLFEIVMMEPKTPITFEDAVNLVEKEFSQAADSGRIGSNPGQSHWYYQNFVQFISDQGYSIELTGDEFETASICSSVN